MIFMVEPESIQAGIVGASGRFGRFIISSIINIQGFCPHDFLQDDVDLYCYFFVDVVGSHCKDGIGCY